MSQSLQLEHYLDSLESLPSELRRNLTLLTDLDERSHGLLLSVEEESRRYRSSVETLSAGARHAALSHVDSLYVRLREFADDKVQLAIQTYELVDKHIRRLDADLARFQMELRERNDAVATEETDVVGATARKRGGVQKASARKGHARAAGEEPAAPIKKRGRKSEQSAAAVVDAPTGVAAITQPSDVLDMPVDPNEPTYCLCHQVSYGEMIGCDNLDCPIEWFHFACVGLTSKPKGKWFCAKCNVDKKK